MKELSYSEFKQAIKYLVLTSSEIYSITFDEIMPLEQDGFNDANALENAIAKIEILRIKEQRILDYIYHNNCSYDIDMALNDAVIALVDDANARTNIFERLEILTTDRMQESFNKSNQRDLEYYNGDNDEDFDYYDEDDDIKYTNEELEISMKTFNHLFFEYLHLTTDTENEEILKGKYNFSFVNPDIETELLAISFNTNNLLILPDELIAKTLNKSQEEFAEIIEDTCLEFLIEKINELEFIGEITNEESTLSLIDFFLSKLNLTNLSDIKDLCLYNLTESLDPVADDIYNKIISMTKKYIHDIKKTMSPETIIIEEEKEKNEETASFTLVEINNIITLLNIEVQTYNLLNQLKNLEVNGQKETKEFKLLIDKLKKLNIEEKEAAFKIIPSPNMKTTLIELVTKCLGLIVIDDKPKQFNEIFKQNKRKSDLIKKRIFALISEDEPLNVSLFKEEDTQEIIENGQILEAMKRYEAYINNKRHNKNLIEYKYEEIFLSEFLLEEYLNNDGDFSKSQWYPDEALYTLLGISESEYFYDKNNILFGLAENIITTLYGLATEEKLSRKDTAKSKFLMFLLETISENLDKERLEVLEEDSQYTDEEYGFKEEIRKIFKKAKPKDTNPIKKKVRKNN